MLLLTTVAPELRVVKHQPARHDLPQNSVRRDAQLPASTMSMVKCIPIAFAPVAQSVSAPYL